MKVLSLYHRHVSRLTALLAVLCAVCVFLYGAFLLMAVAHAAELRTLEEELSSLESSASELQSQYLIQTKSLTLERALELGFVAPIAQTTISVGELGLSLVPGTLR